MCIVTLIRSVCLINIMMWRHNLNCLIYNYGGVWGPHDLITHEHLKVGTKCSPLCSRHFHPFLYIVQKLLHFIQISRNFILKVSINANPVLAQIIDWHRTCFSLLLNPDFPPKLARIDRSHKSHDILLQRHFCSELCIVGYGTGAWWDLCDWFIRRPSRENIYSEINFVNTGMNIS